MSLLQGVPIEGLQCTLYLFRYQIKEAGKTKFQARQLDNAPRVIKPVAFHAELEKPKQVEKRARESRELVLDLIFTAFQSHQYYSLKDLVHKTKQPTVRWL